MTPMAILSVSVNLGRNNIFWIRFTSDLLSTAKFRVSSYCILIGTCGYSFRSSTESDTVVFGEACPSVS